MSKNRLNVTNNNSPKLDKSTFLKKLMKDQKDFVINFIDKNTSNLRKTVYISSGGKYYKYVDFILAFVYRMGYVPIHPILNLNYYISTLAHNYDKGEIVKDCFSLIDGCDELWVIDEASPNLGDSMNQLNTKALSSFPEGVLMEMFYWLSTKPNQPIRFFTWQDIGAPKYMLLDKWSLIKSTRGFDDNKTPGRFAIIDLGSSTVKLTLCEIKEDKILDTFFKKSITVNLAENFFDDLTLKSAPIERTIQAVLDLQKTALDYGIMDIVVVGTGVLRKAKNIDEFKLMIKKDTDLELRIITGKDEALMIYRSIENSFQDIDRNLIVVNAGGGSTEVVIGSNGEVEQYSIPLGISEVNEKFIKNYPVSNEDYLKVKEFISIIIKKNIKKNNVFKRGQNYLVYSGGELDYMIITGFPLIEFNSSMSHPKMIKFNDLLTYTKKMRSMTLEKLQSYMPNNPAWMNGAIASNTILETFAEYFNSDSIIPSNMNLNDGILLEMVK